METIERDKVQELIDSPESAIVIEVLPESQFRRAHLPDSINVPLGDDFENRVVLAVPSKSCPVIVYCSDSECPASSEAARRMDAMGYTNVFDYAGGKEDWRESDLPMIETPQGECTANGKG